MVSGKDDHLLNSQAFKIWYADVLDLISSDQSAITADQVSQMPHRHSLVLTKIGKNFTLQETVDLPLTLGLGTELSSSHLH